jgi:RNA polymerase sigma-70 factor (ECF subfamily)
MKTTRQPARKAVLPESDERVLVEAAKKDPAKFDALYEMQFERVYAFIANRVRDRATAEDLTSEVFHKALANLAKYEWRGVPFAAWLLRIAANAVIDHGKRSARGLPAVDDLVPVKAEPRLVEDQARLFRLVQQLPEVQRQVVHQRFVEQLSIREVAGRLGKTEGAVKQLQLRALQHLRAQMGGGDA